MKTNRKWCLFLLIIALFATLFSGCGGKESAETTAASAEATTEGTTAEATAVETTAATTEASTANPLAWDYSEYITAEYLGELALPQNTDVFNSYLALQLMAMSVGQTTGESAHLLGECGGFEVVLQKNYDKSTDNESHTCAYTVGRKELTFRNEVRPTYLIAVRSTVEGEWISNLNVAADGDYDSAYAMNFRLAAEDVYNGVSSLPMEENPLFIVCGYSRGAACANLLSVMLDDAYGAENVFAYTFATPATVRADKFQNDYPNIFNIINPCDMVPLLPMPGWGFARAGVDVMLSADADAAAEAAATADALAALVPNMRSYYEDRYAITGPGLSEDGLTVYEMACLTIRVSYGGLTPESGTKLLQLSQMSPESGLASAFSYISGDLLVGATQHMPQVYAQLLLAEL